MEKQDLRSMNREELSALLKQMNQPAFRAGQLFSWIQKENADDFSVMTNLPLSLRQQLAEQADISLPKARRIARSRKDETVKFLFELQDGLLIESVRMHYTYGDTLCISTQAGCNMACSFCATGLGGKARNLTAGEMLGQIAAAEKLLDISINHVVLMGMGEPLDNFEAVTRFLDLVSDEKGRNLTPRHITLSTCGIVPNIYALADQNRQITLTVSLHAAEDAKRSMLMPVNRRWGLGELIPACKYYFQKTGRRVSFEYALIAGENDNRQEAEALAALLQGFPCHINLIPINPVKETGKMPPSPEQIRRFSALLEERGFSVTRRRTLGQDIDAACGQLRRKEEARANHT